MLPLKQYTFWKGITLVLVPTVLSWNLLGPNSVITALILLLSFVAAMTWKIYSARSKV